jgi:hypothetical protein
MDLARQRSCNLVREPIGGITVKTGENGESIGSVRHNPISCGNFASSTRQADQSVRIRVEATTISTLFESSNAI